MSDNKKKPYPVPVSIILGQMLYKRLNKGNFSSFREFIYGERLNKEKPEQ